MDYCMIRSVHTLAKARALKEALAETLHEHREFLYEIFAEVVEDYALVDAIRRGRQTDEVPRDEIDGILKSQA